MKLYKYAFNIFEFLLLCSFKILTLYKYLLCILVKREIIITLNYDATICIIINNYNTMYVIKMQRYTNNIR